MSFCGVAATTRGSCDSNSSAARSPPSTGGRTQSPEHAPLRMFDRFDAANCAEPDDDDKPPAFVPMALSAAIP